MTTRLDLAVLCKFASIQNTKSKVASYKTTCQNNLESQLNLPKNVIIMSFINSLPLLRLVMQFDCCYCEFYLLRLSIQTFHNHPNPIFFSVIRNLPISFNCFHLPAIITLINRDVSAQRALTMQINLIVFVQHLKQYKQHQKQQKAFYLYCHLFYGWEI